jgi:flagellar biosynthesis/type III secretory pathway M-ring protein FliF/YscJ
MLEFLKRDDLVSMKHLNELIKGLNKKEESRKVNPWLIVGLVTLGLLVAGLIVYKVFFADDHEYDEFDEFDDEFEDMDYDDDYDEFDEFEEVDDSEDDFEEDTEEETEE